MAWRFLAANTAWVLGAAVMLSVWTLTSFHAASRGLRGGLRYIGSVLSYRRTLFVGALLVSAGQALIAQQIWRQVVWVVVCILCLYGWCRHD